MDFTQKEGAKETSTHLVVIIDISPDSQILRKEVASRKDAANKEQPYQDWISSIIAFCNAHLMLDHRNQLTVIISGLDNNQIVFPTKKKLDEKKSSKPLEGQYELFSEVSNEVLSKIKEMIGDTRKVLEQMSSGNTARQFSSVLAGSVAIGLCRIQRLSESVDESRICIITSSRETPAFYASQYMNFMNGFFSAQKMRVAIDCFTVDDTNELLTNSILQQGCDLTNGFYLKISNVAATLEYLMWVFLPSVETRKKMILPTKTKISYKASCFCHRNQVDIGYVCSVCLSIFCQFNPICSTCQTVFKLGPEPNVKVKKRKTTTP